MAIKGKQDSGPKKHRAVYGGVELHITRTEWEYVLGMGATRLSSMLRKYNTMQGVIDNCPDIQTRTLRLLCMRNFIFPSRIVDQDSFKDNVGALA